MKFSGRKYSFLKFRISDGGAARLYLLILSIGDKNLTNLHTLDFHF